MDDSQLLRGILEGCVLSVIARGETYGYLILDELQRSGFEDLFEGTLYPVLTRLEKRGYISCRREKSPFGPVRKYYSVTGEGREALLSFRESYNRITGACEKVLTTEEEK
ncbi:MAG: PadR family transcriptional regulator [Ruminococcaceae bacterium]|nr:PadR family transcriptional regulator [Oscillospiraceae bacterium]